LKFLINNDPENNSLNYFSVIKNQSGFEKNVSTHTSIYYAIFKSYYYTHEERPASFKKNAYRAHFNFLGGLVKKNKVNYVDSQQDSYKRSKNLPVVVRFLNYLFRHGLKIKTLNHFNKGLCDFYFLFYFFDKGLSSDNKNYKDIFNLAPAFGSFYKFTNILSFLVRELEPFFYLRVTKVEKKYRKKLKKKFTSKITYIDPKKRSNLAFKALAYYPKLFPQYSLYARIGQGLFKTFIEKKDSYLYRRKIFMYSKVLKKFQKAIF
jgi:hypothetical protein